MKYGLYCRKSSEDSGKQIQSLDNQIQYLTEKARKEGLTISKIYQESKSAKLPYKREKFQQMINDLQDGVIDGIICWKLDRLSRNPICGAIVQHFLMQGTIKQIVTHEKTYYPEDNSIMMSVELGMATEYSQALGKNVKRGLNFKVAKGHFPNTAPIGYLNTAHLNNGERTIIIDPDRAPFIRKLWDLLLIDKLSIREIVEKASAIGLKTRATRLVPEKKLSRWGVHCIFANPFYYGVFKWGKELHQGQHQPLVTKGEFDAAQILIASRKSSPRPAKYVFPLKGFIRCGECGASVTAEQKNKVRKDGSVNQRTYYRCTHRIKGSDCKQPTIREENLEQQFEEIFGSITIPVAFVEWAARWLQDEREDAAAKRDSILKLQQKQIEKINQGVDRLLELRINGEIEPELFQTKKVALINQKRDIEREMSLNTDSDEHRINKTVETLEFCKEARKMFTNGNSDDKKLVLRTLCSHFTLKDGKLSVELAKPFELVKDSVDKGWILDSRFATLKTCAVESQSASECLLIEYGADDET